MVHTHDCPLCGHEYAGSYCICEYMEDDEREAYKEHDIYPERLKHYTREEIDADYASSTNWQSWYD